MPLPLKIVLILREIALFYTNFTYKFSSSWSKVEGHKKRLKNSLYFFKNSTYIKTFVSHFFRVVSFTAPWTLIAKLISSTTRWIFPAYYVCPDQSMHKLEKLEKYNTLFIRRYLRFRLKKTWNNFQSDERLMMERCLFLEMFPTFLLPTHVLFIAAVVIH